MRKLKMKGKRKKRREGKMTEEGQTKRGIKMNNCHPAKIFAAVLKWPNAGWYKAVLGNIWSESFSQVFVCFHRD